MERTEGASFIRGQCVFGSLSPRCRHTQLEVNNKTVTTHSIADFQWHENKIKLVAGSRQSQTHFLHKLNYFIHTTGPFGLCFALKRLFNLVFGSKSVQASGISVIIFSETPKRGAAMK